MNAELKNKLDNLSRELNISINDYNLYIMALTHASYANEHRNENVRDYQRLEFFGDAILGFLVAEYLYNNEKVEEGDMTKLRAEYVCESANSDYTEHLGLDDLILVGNGVKAHDGISQAIKGDVFESFLGAMYLDHNNDIDYIRKFLEKFLFPHIILKDGEYLIDYKSKLQEYFQAETRITVNYVLVSESGPAHDKEFITSVYHEGLLLGTGKGKSKKISEQLAAKDALEKMAGGNS